MSHKHTMKSNLTEVQKVFYLIWEKFLQDKISFNSIYCFNYTTLLRKDKALKYDFQKMTYDTISFLGKEGSIQPAIDQRIFTFSVGASYRL